VGRSAELCRMGNPSLWWLGGDRRELLLLWLLRLRLFQLIDLVLLLIVLHLQLRHLVTLLLLIVAAIGDCAEDKSCSKRSEKHLN